MTTTAPAQAMTDERIEDLMRLVFAYGRWRVDVDRSNGAYNQRGVSMAIEAIRSFAARALLESSLARGAAATTPTQDGCEAREAVPASSRPDGKEQTSAAAFIEGPVLPHETRLSDKQVRELMQVAHRWAGPDEDDARSDELEMALRAIRIRGSAGNAGVGVGQGKTKPGQDANG